MNPIQEAKGLLADTEKGLRELMQRELKAQRYGDLAQLASITDSLSRLAGGLTADGGSSTIDAKSTAQKPELSVPSLKPKSRSSSKANYPRFKKDEDKLVKIGWSKKSREEYEHRGPRKAVLAFAQHLGRNTALNKVFVIESLLPVHDSAGEEIPSYQVYMSLAWLRQAGAVEKKGRDGYVRILDPLDGSAFDTLWDQIPKRS